MFWRCGSIWSGAFRWPRSSASSISRARSEANEVGLRLQLDSELLAHAILNHPHKLDHFSRCAATAIDDRQGVLRRDADVSVHEAFFKSGVLDEPCGGQLHVFA